MTVRRRTRAGGIVVLLATMAAGCTAAGGQDVSAAQRGVSEIPSTTATVPVPPPPPARSVHEQAWTPFAAVGGVVLRHPSARVERIGYHQSNHDGARGFEPLPTSAPQLTLDARELRATSARTAADVMIDPEVEVRSPVSGRVKFAGTYVLYCDYRDDFVVIAPDDRPAWEVKVLHIDGVTVRSGDRVQAGETVIAPRPTRLPFDSQVEETSARPAWPHVHIEVIDPSIRDIPNGKGC